MRGSSDQLDVATNNIYELIKMLENLYETLQNKSIKYRFTKLTNALTRQYKDKIVTYQLIILATSNNPLRHYIKMTLIQWNINGLGAHLNQLQIIMAEHKSVYICIQESRLRPEQECNYKVIKNYRIFRKGRLTGGNASGDVSIHAKNSIDCKQIHLQTELDAIAVTINYPENFTIFCIYLPPRY